MTAQKQRPPAAQREAVTKKSSGKIDQPDCTAWSRSLFLEVDPHEYRLRLAGVSLILDVLARRLDADQLDEIERRLLERALAGAIA